MSPIVWNGSARSMPPIWAAVGLESSGFTDSKRCDTRTRCSACKVPCAGCNRCADQGHYRAALSALHFSDDRANAVTDVAPVEPFLTGYDMNHLVTYLRLLDADADGADWREVATIVLSLDVEKHPERANRVWER